VFTLHLPSDLAFSIWLTTVEDASSGGGEDEWGRGRLLNVTRRNQPPADRDNSGTCPETWNTYWLVASLAT
jgi:hypothetical protein